jgi:hypothetical protein
VRLLLKASHEDGSSFRGLGGVNRKEFMKFVSLRRKRARRQDKLEKQFRISHESCANPSATSGQIHTYAELRRQIHDDLRVQHPEWVQPDGRSPMCDSYEVRLMELLDPLIRKRANGSIG